MRHHLSRLGSTIATAVGALLVACAAPAPAGPSSAVPPGSQPASVAAPLAASSSGSGSAGSATTPAAQAEWERTLADARQEGVVAVGVQPGQLFRDWFAQFENAYPGIKLEITGTDLAQFGARVVTERERDQYLWDVYVGGPGTAHAVLKPAGALDPLKPALMLPEVLDDSKWLGGFDDGFTDLDRAYVYDYFVELSPVVYVNRDFVSEAELSRVEDLADPRWRGRISILEPRQAGSGAVAAAHFVQVKGEDWWRQLLGQDLVVTNDRRQQLEWAARGRNPIAIGASSSVLVELQQQNVARNLLPLAFDTPLGARVSLTRALALFNRAPHPNAARVLVNWLLSREGQRAYVQYFDEASRRLDVGSPTDRLPDPTVQYLTSINKEVSHHYEARAMEIAKELLR
jgi:iron(III) transport system substrate-binding protein